MKYSDAYRRIHVFLELGMLRTLVLGLNFLSMPIFLRYLGVEEFGVYSVLLAFFAIGTMFDLGVSNALISSLAIAYERRNFVKMKNIVSNSILALVIGTGAFSFLAIFLALTLDVENILNIPQSTSQEFSLSILVVLILVVPNCFSLLPSKISIAFGRTRESALWTTWIAILTVALSLFVVTQTKSLLYLMLTQTLTPILMGIIYFGRILVLFPEIRPSLLESNLDSLREVLLRGRTYFVLQVASVLSYQLDLIVVGVFLNNESITELSFTWKIASIPYLLVSASLLPFWQKSAILYDKEGSVEALTFKMIKTLVPFLLSWTIFFFFFGNRIISVWSEGEIIPSRALIFWCGIWAFLASLMSALSLILNGINSSKFLLMSTIAFTIMNVLISIMATRVTQSPIGPILGSTIAAILCFFTPLVFSFNNILSQRSTAKGLNDDNYL